MTKSTLILALSSLFAFAPLARAESAKAPPEAKDHPTVMVERGKQLVSQDFAGSTLPAEWKAAKGKWEVANGVLKGSELVADKHAAVVRTDLKAHDLIAQYSFRFDGGKQTSFSLNNAKGHVCRAVITPTSLSISRDGDKKDLKPAQLDRTAITLSPGEWHTLVVEVHGKDMLASLDGGQQVVYGANDGVDVEKTNFGFPSGGESVSFAHVRVWEAGAVKSDWEAAKQKLESRPKAKNAAAAAK